MANARNGTNSFGEACLGNACLRGVFVWVVRLVGGVVVGRWWVGGGYVVGG